MTEVGERPCPVCRDGMRSRMRACSTECEAELDATELYLEYTIPYEVLVAAIRDDAPPLSYVDFLDDLRGDLRK